MAHDDPGVQFRPAGERLARVETLLEGVQGDVTEIKRQLSELTEQHAKQDAYARVGHAVWSITERVVLVLLGSGAAMWLQRHWPPGAN
jgi:hypothetical protein